MIKMMSFFNSSPFETDKISDHCVTGENTPGKPSISSESEPDTVSIESTAEETQPKDQMKTESRGQDCDLRDSLVPSTEANGNSSHSSDKDSPRKKGIRKKLKDVFSSFPGGKKKVNPVEKDGAVTENKPLTVEQIRKHLEGDQFFGAIQHLIALERALYSLDDKNDEEMSQDQSKVESLYEILKNKVFGIIKNSIALAQVNPKLLFHAVCAIVEQEAEDEKYNSEKPPDKIVSHRPRKWREIWMDTVKQSVADRMKDTERTSSSENLSTAALCFLHMGRTMKEDMIIVVEHIKQHYPAQFNVCRTYAECYHHYFSSQLQLIAEFELGDKDIYLLLTWVQNLYPNDIQRNSVLVKELDEAKLGSLLPPKMIKQLEAKYLCNEAASVKNWLAKSLEMEVKRWTEEKEPEKLDGRFHSELAIDVIQTIHGGQKRAAEITSELGKELSVVLLVELMTFLKSYKKALEEFKEKNKQHSYFKATIIANINNCMSFRDHTKKTTTSAQDSMSGKILTILGEIENSGYDVLLQALILELKPIFRKLTQNKWLSCSETMNEILQVTSNHISEFKTLHDPLYQGIVEKIHGHVVREYIVRLMKKKVSLKIPELQQNLSKLISAHASLLQNFCKEKGSKAMWLDSALPQLAEIIRLQDSGAIKIEVATLASKYPDISKKHLAAILYIKGNLPSNEVKSILSILDVSAKPTTSSEALFSAMRVL